MSEKLPTNALRLFAHYEDAELLPSISPELVIPRLLEEGDASDLRWLVKRYPEPRLASWLDHHATRLLSRRSRSFWRIVLDRPDPSAAGPGEQLWRL